MMPPLLRVFRLIMLCGLIPAFAAAEVRTVRDWTGECDDDLNCTATASGGRGMVMGCTDCENGRSSDEWPIVYKHQAK
jgi:hypothetical protein